MTDWQWTPSIGKPHLRATPVLGRDWIYHLFEWHESPHPHWANDEGEEYVPRDFLAHRPAPDGPQYLSFDAPVHLVRDSATKRWIVRAPDKKGGE